MLQGQQEYLGAKRTPDMLTVDNPKDRASKDAAAAPATALKDAAPRAALDVTLEDRSVTLLAPFDRVSNPPDVLHEIHRAYADLTPATFMAGIVEL